MSLLTNNSFSNIERAALAAPIAWAVWSVLLEVLYLLFFVAADGFSNLVSRHLIQDAGSQIIVGLSYVLLLPSFLFALFIGSLLFSYLYSGLIGWTLFKITDAKNNVVGLAIWIILCLLCSFGLGAGTNYFLYGAGFANNNLTFLIYANYFIGVLSNIFYFLILSNRERF